VVAMYRSDLYIALLLTLLTQLVVIVAVRVDVGNLLYAPVIQLVVGFLLIFFYRVFRKQRGDVFSFGWFYLLVVLSGITDVLMLWTILLVD